MTPATSPPPRASPHEMSDQEAMEILGRLCQSDRRSEFAQAIFPYDPEKYRSKSEWRKAVGTRVSNDIHRDAELCMRMYRAGYKPRVTGYTLEQRMILVKYYALYGAIKNNNYQH